MKTRLTRTIGAAFEDAEFAGKNTTGCDPLNDLVLVLPDAAKETMGDKGLILRTNDSQEQMQLAAETGVIVAIGEGAFNWARDRMREYVGYKPKVGDRVFYQRYAGQLMIGDDDVEYRYMSDKEIALVKRTPLPGKRTKAKKATADKGGAGIVQRETVAVA